MPSENLLTVGTRFYVEQGSYVRVTLRVLDSIIAHLPRTIQVWHIPAYSLDNFSEQGRRKNVIDTDSFYLQIQEIESARLKYSNSDH